MYEEDLLPRPPPIPIQCSVPEAAPKLEVPEVSIILGDPRPLPKTSSVNNAVQKPIQSYTAWKKQCLPHVMYADEGLQAGSSTENSPRNNIYPMKQTIPQHTRLSTSPQPHQVRIATPPLPLHHVSPANTQQTNRVLPTPSVQLLEQSLGVDNNLLNSLRQLLGLRDPVHTQPTTPTREQLLQSIQPNCSNVLTICAGTQTDVDLASYTKPQDYATKDDIREVMKTIEEMRSEQIQLMHLLKMSLETRSVTREVGTQCEMTANHIQSHQPLALEDYRATPKGNFQKILPRTPQQNFRTPNAQNFKTPTAQPNLRTPNVQNFKTPILAKPTTEQSMVINELAMKYLPSHKLSDLLQEIHTQENHSPLRMIDNVMRTPVTESPNDMSNASYKYLKKYRLLPEEEENQDLDLDAIRNQPKFV